MPAEVGAPRVPFHDRLRNLSNTLLDFYELGDFEGFDPENEAGWDVLNGANTASLTTLDQLNRFYVKKHNLRYQRNHHLYRKFLPNGRVPYVAHLADNHMRAIFINSADDFNFDQFTLNEFKYMVTALTTEIDDRVY